MSTAVPGIDVISVAVDRQGNRYAQFRCPGCIADDDQVGLHSLPVRPFTGTQDSWTWNGDVVRPVFSPSVLGRWKKWQGADVPPKPCVCHSFVGCNGAQPGQIIYLGDCTHALAGQVVALPPWSPA